MHSIPLDERAIKDQDVFSAFDLSLPGLKPVREALDRQDLKDAKKLLIRYMEHRGSPRFLFDYRSLPLTPIDTDTCPYSFQSSLGLSGSLKEFCLHVARKLMEEHTYVLPGGDRQVNLGKNWENMIHFNIYEDTGKIHRSYLDMMVRGQFFESLCVLYHETKDAGVLDFFEEMLQVFFDTYPLVITHADPSADRFQYTEDRDVMSVGWLAVVYISLFYTRVPYEISTELSFEILKRIWFLGIQFKRFATDSYRPYNHHMWERGMVPFILGTMFPEIPDFKAMRDRGALIVCRHIKEDFNEAGGYSEHSIAYWSGAAVGEMLYRVIYLARQNGENLLDEETAGRLNETFHILAMLCPPGKRYPTLGDNNGPLLEPILDLGVRTMDHRECRQILAIRRGGAPSPERQKEGETLPLDFCSHHAGFVCSKSGYGPDSSYMMMSAKIRCGCSGHNHMDMLSLFLTMRGRELIGEPYSGLLYHSIRMNSDLRGYMYNMPSHNTVLAYGRPIAPNRVYANKWGVYRPDSPVTAYRSGQKGIYASAYHDGYTFCRHTREILFHRERGLIVSDRIMRGNRLDEPHIQRWNLMPGALVTAAGDDFALVEKEGARFLFLWSGAPRRVSVTHPELLVPEIIPEKEDLAPILDIAFHALEEDRNKNVTVTLNLLILDITDSSQALSENKLKDMQARLEALCKDLKAPQALDTFPCLP